MRPSILVAEEDPAVRELLTRVLSGAGYAVTPVPDGDQAVARLAGATPFAAAVLDHRMPGLTGPEVVARVRPTRPDLPVLVVSGGGDPAVAASLAADPHTHFLAKPFGLTDLVRVVGGLVGGPPGDTWVHPALPDEPTDEMPALP